MVGIATISHPSKFDHAAIKEGTNSVFSNIMFVRGMLKTTTGHSRNPDGIIYSPMVINTIYRLIPLYHTIISFDA